MKQPDIKISKDDTINDAYPIFRNSCRKVNVSQMPHAKFNLKIAGSYVSILRSIAKHTKSKGLDFGCGVGLGLILAKLLKINLVGLDILVEDKDRRTYVPLQNQLKRAGYKIILRNTREFPWTEFKDDEFNFIIARYSFGKDNSGIPRESDWQENRIRELSRIAAPRAIWAVVPGKLRDHKTFMELAAQKHFRILHGKHVKSAIEM